MSTYLIIGVITVALFVIIRQTVLLVALYKSRYKAKDYNRFVDDLYTQNGKDTPAIIGRIQYSYIEAYNNRRKRCSFLSLFFRAMPLLGEPSQRGYELFNTI